MRGVVTPDVEAGNELEKRVATLRACFALAGFQMVSIRPSGGERYFEVRRWGEARMFRTVHDVESFLTQVGAA